MNSTINWIFSLLVLFFFLPLFSEEKMPVVIQKLSDTIWLPKIAKLRAEVFREYPYLFDAEEKEHISYLQEIVVKPNSIILIAIQEDCLIGALTAIPLKELHTFFLTPFIEKKLDYATIFFIDELMIDKQYRSKGIGKRLYQALEMLVKEKEIFDTISLLQIVRPQNHPNEPTPYQPASLFWEKMGFSENPSMKAKAYYKEIATENKVFNLMIYSFKLL